MGTIVACLPRHCKLCTFPTLAIIKCSDMTQTALYQRLASEQATVGAYNGAETVLRFTNPRAELGALLTASAVFHPRRRRKNNLPRTNHVCWFNPMTTTNKPNLAPTPGSVNTTFY